VFRRGSIAGVLSLAYASYVDTTTLATLVADLASWVADLDAVIDGAIIGNHIKINVPVTGTHKAATGATFVASRVEQTAVINFSNSVTPHKYGQVIPSVRSDLLTTGKIDLTDTAMAALIALLKSGAFTNAAQQALVTVIDAIVSFRKRRKQLSRTSFEV
jgi:hypothetical protein